MIPAPPDSGPPPRIDPYLSPYPPHSRASSRRPSRLVPTRPANSAPRRDRSRLQIPSFPSQTSSHVPTPGSALNSRLADGSRLQPRPPLPRPCFELCLFLTRLSLRSNSEMDTCAGPQPGSLHRQVHPTSFTNTHTHQVKAVKNPFKGNSQESLSSQAQAASQVRRKWLS